MVSGFRRGVPSASPAVLDPADKLLAGGTQLQGIGVGEPLGHQTFVERTIPARIQLPQLPIQLLRAYGRRVMRPYTIKGLRQGHLPVIMLREGRGQEFLAFSQRRTRHARSLDVIEHQQGATAQPMAAVQGLAVEPFEGDPIADEHRTTQAL